MKNLTMILILLVYAMNTIAQDSSFSARYDASTILLYGDRYTVNGKKLNRNQLEWTMDEFEVTKKEYVQFKKSDGRSTWLALLSLGLLVTSITQIDKKPDLGLGLLISGLTTTIISIPIANRGKKHLQKSVWLYNREILK